MSQNTPEGAAIPQGPPSWPKLGAPRGKGLSEGLAALTLAFLLAAGIVPAPASDGPATSATGRALPQALETPAEAPQPQTSLPQAPLPPTPANSPTKALPGEPAKSQLGQSPSANRGNSQGRDLLAKAEGPITTETFLDHLMQAESGGRDTAKNPRSTALGPFQFIEATFLHMVRNHFAQETAGMNDLQILSLRTDRAFARQVAEAFTADNATMLASEGLPVSFPNLRLAFLLGPTAAVRVLQAPPETPVGHVVGSAVIWANPFMASLTTADLIARAARDLALPAPRLIARPRDVPWPKVASAASSGGLTLPSSPIARMPARDSRRYRPAAERRPQQPQLAVHCNRDLPSCRRWISIHTRLLAARGGGRRPLATALR